MIDNYNNWLLCDFGTLHNNTNHKYNTNLVTHIGYTYIYAAPEVKEQQHKLMMFDEYIPILNT